MKHRPKISSTVWNNQNAVSVTEHLKEYFLRKSILKKQPMRPSGQICTLLVHAVVYYNEQTWSWHEILNHYGLFPYFGSISMLMWTVEFKVEGLMFLFSSLCRSKDQAVYGCFWSPLDPSAMNADESSACRRPIIKYLCTSILFHIQLLLLFSEIILFSCTFVHYSSFWRGYKSTSKYYLLLCQNLKQKINT